MNTSSHTTPAPRDPHPPGRCAARIGWLLAVVTTALAGLCTTPGTVQAQQHQGFRVMTYNVRHETGDDTGNYAWAKRKAGVVEMIRSRNPDVFGVQEVSSKPIRDALRAAFNADFDHIRPDGGSPKMIFYRKSRFERLQPDQTGNLRLQNPYAENDACRPNANGRTVAWVKLRDRRSGRVYMFMNMHTAHAKNCWQARNLAADGVHQLIADKLAPGETPVLMGDFNMDEQRDPAPDARDKLVTKLEENKANYRLRRSARHSGKTNKSSWTFNNEWKASSATRQRLDYIFVDSTDATTYRQAIDQQTIKDLLGTGANISPSDHFLVRAEIRHAPFHHQALVSTPTGIANDHISFGDVNGDGRTDLIRWKTDLHSGRVRVHLADAQGRFASEPIVDHNSGEVGEWRFFADIDGDGCADRISWSNAIADATVRVGKSRCDGTFESAETQSPGTTKSGTKWFFAKLNDDACFDRIAWHPQVSGGQTRVALAKCDGSLGFHAEKLTTDAGTTTLAGATLAFADINGDGRADKILWDLTQHGGRTMVYTSKGNGDFAFFKEHTGGSSGVATTRLYFGDVDGDGFAEKAFWRPNFRQGYMQLYPGAASGLIGHPMMVNSGPSERESTAYHLADVNGDGSADLIRWDLAKNPNQIEVFRALVVQAQPEPQEPDEPDEPEEPEDPQTPGEPEDPGHPDDPDAGDEDGWDAGEDADAGTSDGRDIETNTDADAPDPHALVRSDGCGCMNSGGLEPSGLLWLGLGLLGVGVMRRRP